MGKSVYSVYRKIKKYVKTHMGVPVIASVVVLLLMTVIILQSYVKNQYFSYLLEETGRTEKAVLEASAENIDNTLKEMLDTSCMIAINANLRSVVEGVLNSEISDLSRSALVLNSQLNAMSHYSSSIAAVTVFSENGVLQEYGRSWAGGGYENLWSDETEEIVNEIYENVMELASASKGIKYYISETPASHASLPGISLFHIAIPIVGGNSNWKNADTIVVVTFRMDSVVGEKNFSNGYITGKGGTIIYHEEQKYIGMDVEEYKKIWSQNEDFVQPLNYFGWEVHMQLDIAGMNAKVNMLYEKGIWVYLVLLGICAVIWQIVLRKTLKPVSNIRDAMEDIRLGRDRKKIELKGEHEIWQLAKDYNAMLDALHNQQEKEKQHFKEKTLSIKQKNKAEMEALESQINAHFLCNTLAAINYNAIENEDYEVAVLLKKLSSILSYSFSKKLATITLGQEIKWVEEYLYLQKFRLMEVFDYEIDFPEEYGEWPSCKLFLQPFVENSIMHGFEGREKGGIIKVVGRIDGNRFCLSVADNGCGMNEETSKVIQDILGNTHTLELNGCGIGVQNAVTRLRMFYGKEIQIQMETVENEGTCFTFWLPLVEKLSKEFL